MEPICNSHPIATLLSTIILYPFITYLALMCKVNLYSIKTPTIPIANHCYITTQYETRIADIQYTKKQQWNVLYYSLIAISGLIALGLQSSYKLIFKDFIAGLYYIILFISTYLQITYHIDISKYRREIKIYKNLFKDNNAPLIIEEIDYYRIDALFVMFVFVILTALSALLGLMLLFCNKEFLQICQIWHY